jgi:hypothetical protein
VELEGRVGCLKADLDEARKALSRQENEISKMKAERSFRGKQKDSAELAAA